MSANGLHRNNECFSPHGFKNDLYFTVAHLYRLMAEITTYILHVACLALWLKERRIIHVSRLFRVMA